MTIAPEARALTLNLSGSIANVAAAQDLKIAADYWDSMLTSTATVNLQVGSSALGANIIASTSSRSAAVTTAGIYHALATTGNSALDAVAVGHLRPLDANGGLAFIDDAILSNGTVSSSARVYDNDDSVNNRYLDVNTAVLKALGYSGYNSGYDATISFSSNFNFDYDPTNGIQAGAIDFLGVAIHEIGHALGFTSGVDTYDYFTQTSSGNGLLNSSAVFSTLDLFRYSADPNDLTPGSGPALDLSTGGNPYFSIDGASAFNGARFSTGFYNGDGHQASHWKDSAGCGAIGIMDPTFCRGGSKAPFPPLAAVTDDDIAAMDALGWNVRIDALTNVNYAMTTAQIYTLMSVPEPASWGLMTLGLGLAGTSLRRRRRNQGAIAA